MFIPESVLFSELEENFRLAAEACDKLAVVPARGPVYEALRAHLAKCELACRQIGFYRQDARWFRTGMMMEEAHRRCGGWLVKHPRTADKNDAHPLFVKLAENLRAGMASIIDMKERATGIRGLVLPDGRPLPRLGQGA